jgi:hypothetical protein
MPPEVGGLPGRWGPRGQRARTGITHLPPMQGQRVVGAVCQWEYTWEGGW